MTEFFYRAKDRNGTLIKGTLRAESAIEAKRILSDRDLAVLALDTGNLARFGADFAKRFSSLFETVSAEDLIVFNRQLQTSYSVGISMVQALSLIGEQSENPVMRKMAKRLVEDLAEGHALHEAMSKHPRIFDPIYVNAVKAGESSGKLDEIFGMLSYFSEQKMDNEGKIKSATLYPKIVLFMIAAVMLVVVTFVMPRLKEFYGRYGGELPKITQIVMGISEAFIAYWYLFAVLFGFLYYAFSRYIATPRGKFQWHAILLKLPVFGAIYLQSDLLAFSTVMRLLSQSGMSILESFEVVKDSLRNEVLRVEIESCRRSVEEGRSVASGFNESAVFPKMVGNLLSVGEESGKIDEVLEKIAQYYKIQLEFRLNNLSKALEPILLVLIFGIVLVILLSVFLPIWKMSQVMRLK